MIENIEKFLDIYVDSSLDESKHESALGNITALLIGQNITLLEIIISLEKCLTSAEEKTRYRSTLLISEILG